ncbi:MAG: penicillin-binding protein 2 [Candidatus Absconditabacterales bacterium]
MTKKQPRTIQTYIHRGFVFLQALEKEQWLIIGFLSLFVIVTMRLMRLQIFNFDYYQNKLITQHFQHVNIQAKRGNIFVESPSGKPVQLTANTEVYDIFVDPKFVLDKPQFIKAILPIFIEHFCPSGTGQTLNDPYSCLFKLERFTDKTLLPTKPVLYYLGGGIASATGLAQAPTSGEDLQDLILSSNKLIAAYQSGQELYNVALTKTLSGVLRETISTLIQEQLNTMIYQGVKERNFLTFIEDERLRQQFTKVNLPYVQILGNTVYVLPAQVTDVSKAGSELYTILSQYQIIFSYKQLQAILSPQDNRYVRLATNMDHQLVTRLKELKDEWSKVQQDNVYNKRKAKEKVTDDDLIPLLHGLGFEQKTMREYPFGTYLAHVLGFLTKNGKPLYGVEEYRDEYLKGKDGQIIGFGTPWIGQVGSNELQLSNPVNGADIVLSIEPNIQKEIERLTNKYLKDLRADSVSIVVMNPYDGSVAGLANAPTFDPNNPDAIYQTKPLEPEYAQLLDDAQYLDIPVYERTGGKMLPVTLEGRFDKKTPKYINANYYGPLAFLDKNTTLAYEPGSIFKPITVGIGLDVDEISLYDTYYDKGELQVGDYFIKNVSRACLGTNTILHALQFSCNIGMIRIIEKIGKYVFYNYLEKLGFGRPTGIEIAGEVSGSIPDAQLRQKSRFFNNSFGQGLLVTPMQMAVAYSSLVNGGYTIRPTIIKKIVTADGQVKHLAKSVKKRIFRETTAESIKMALYEVVNGGQIKRFAISGKTLAGKTGTSQISFKGKYQNGVGRTNGSFAGIVTRDNTKYVIVIQVRRPRTSQWGETTAGQVYGELSKFLVEYEDIDS